MPLTDAKCRNAKGQAKPYKLSEGGGLHLLVSPDGSKYWRLGYQFHGKQRTLACGIYPSTPLAGANGAREQRDEAKRQLAAGIDPSVAKKERKRAAKVAASNSFEAVAGEWHDNWKSGRTPGYAEQVLRRLEADVFPVLGRRPITDIEPPQVLDVLCKVEARGTHETARRLKQVVGQVFALRSSRAAPSGIRPPT